jgi:hypothetical protein
MCLLNTIDGSGLHIDLRTTETLFCVLLVNTLTNCLFYQAVILNTSIFVPWLVVAIVVEDGLDFLVPLLFMVAFIALNLMAVYWRE